MLKHAAVHFISFYQYFISPTLPPCCRYNPSCSQYAKEAFSRYGIFKGFYLSIKRLLRCHPFAKGGDDFLR
ncbi:MAG: membrane protein insertion efficiency factor YidD [Candidatus Fischerbacteria bacterium RBG_13_37_8]|uniref:Putative membrane protein insertion efficiency factor n=1 Tax=Candidatus Fischerbacteria bacterium RBG_13_37_8 TaxID=1817863 RepID=A0A1F5VKU1_9BACT|nr:MAG: membrane protein insertion efficiency factor YidD [Candidatus Fischerbacteria bacterium RBG_13_37_8]